MASIIPRRKGGFQVHPRPGFWGDLHSSWDEGGSRGSRKHLLWRKKARKTLKSRHSRGF